MNKKMNRVFAVLFVAVLLVFIVIGGLYIARDTQPAPEPAADEPLIPVRPETRAERDSPPATDTEAAEMDPETMERGSEQVDEEAAAPDQTAVVKAPSPERPIPPDGPFEKTPDLLGQESFRIDPPMQEIGKAWLDATGRSDFSMPVTGGKELEIEVDRFEMIGENGGEFTGSVKGRPGSSVNLSYRGSSEAGVIRLPSENRLILIMPGQDGGVVVQERDLAMAEQANAKMPLNMDIPPVPDFTPPPPPEFGDLQPPSN